MILNNLYWDLGDWWRRQRLHFGWTEDIGCATERGFHCRAPVGWLAPRPVPVPIIHVIHVPVPVKHVPEYLVVGPDSAPGVWAVVSSMHGTHLKHRQCLQPISFNNWGSRLTRVMGVVWDPSIICDNWCSLTKLITNLNLTLTLLYTCYDKHLTVYMTWFEHLILLMTWCTPDYSTDWLIYCSFMFGMLF